jgi:hypothetical protein
MEKGITALADTRLDGQIQVAGFMDKAAVGVGVVHLPLVDRFVYPWMWRQGAWEVRPPRRRTVSPPG